MSTPARIPIPMRQRVQDARMRAVPVVVFAATLVAAGMLWNEYIAAPTLVGQVEPVQANVSSYKPGMLAELNVTRFQQVKAGDTVGQILVTDPKILASSLAVIQADIEVLRVGMQPIATQQRNAMSYDRLRLDWMEARARLAMAKVNLQEAISEFRRMDQLFKEQIVSQRAFEQAKAAQDRYQNEVDELTMLVAEQEKNSTFLQSTNATDLAKVSEDPLRAAIAVEESKLRLTEAELSPITLKAPVDGMVDLVYHRSGEAITAGEPIVTIAVANAVRIIGYLRPPILHEPTIGMAVQVRTRGVRREVGSAKILEIGTQLETITPALMPPVRLANAELGLPIGISMPSNLRIRPGELVDLTLLPGKD